MVLDRNAAITFRYERWRALASGILESAAITFLLLIAVRWFDAGPTSKALVAAGGSLGLLLTPLTVVLVARFGWPASLAASRLAAFGALAFLLMILVPVLPVFVLGSVLAMAASSAGIPLLTQIYQENYPAKIRGHLFSRTVMIRIAAVAFFSEVAGRLLTGHIRLFPVLLLVFGGAFLLSSYCLQRCPSTPLTSVGGTHPLRALRLVRQDPIFRRTLVSWMLMGFANLMMLPMRVEYLANPDYGLALSVAEVAFLTGVLPNLARLALSPLWGWLFDRMNFFALRICLNAGFALGILAFFTSNKISGLLLGALVFGASNAGGDVAWSLWVTKFAPPNHVADYMSVHTFLTGIRGFVAPLAAFHLAAQASIGFLGFFAAGLIALASLLLVPEIVLGRRGRAGEALVENLSE